MMNKIEEEFLQYDRIGSWHQIYQKIRQDSLMQHDFSVKDAKRPEFKGRNRYRDVSPYDHSRVKLERDELDYINASLVECPNANRSYILTQGPLPNTAAHFWLLIWESNSQAILMLNRVIEKGQVKCHQYFPMSCENEDEDEILFEDVGLRVSFVSEENANFYIIRTLEIEDVASGNKKKVLQFHYTTWPDFGVPESPEAFLDFLFAVRKAGVLEKTCGPAVIHCSAGIGRSGTFCLVDTCLLLLERCAEGDLSVLDILMEMRSYRMGLIQTPDQLRFSYMAIIEGAKYILPTPSIDSGIDDNLCQSSSSGASSLPTDPVTVDDLSDNAPSTPPPIPPRALADNNNPPLSKLIDYTDIMKLNEGATCDVGAELHKELTNEKLRDEALETRRLQTQTSEIRRRNRDDRKKNTAEQLARMKRKQAESEEWSSRKSQMSPYIWGLSLAVLVGSYVLYRYYGT